jgi:hypothetical protein
MKTDHATGTFGHRQAVKRTLHKTRIVVDLALRSSSRPRDRDKARSGISGLSVTHVFHAD